MISAASPPFFILTGSPGSGKTTLLQAMSQHIQTVSEPARRVLAAERTIGGTATGDQDSAAFVEQMRDMSIADFISADGPTLFDRGLPDLLAFCQHYQLPTEAVRSAVDSYRYAQTVFLLPAWREIYQTDAERTLDFDGAAAFGALTREAYIQSGYRIIDVPKIRLEERVAFLLANLER